MLQQASRRCNRPGLRLCHDVRQMATPLSPESQDCIITPYLFSCFNRSEKQQVFNHINQHLKPGGIWIDADFVAPQKNWQRLLERIMISGFQAISGISAKKISANADLFLTLKGFTPLHQQLPLPASFTR